MKEKISTIFIFLFLVQSVCFSAIDETVRISNYSFEDGLTTSSINNIIKDSKGFIWLCSPNGLFRYDGYSFRNFNSLSSIQIKCEVFCVTEDKNQNLWIGTIGNGIYLYNTHLDKLTHVNISLGNDVRINQIFFFQEKTWIATNIGLLVVDKIQNYEDIKELKYTCLTPVITSANPQDRIINCLLNIEGSHSIWVGTNGALYELNTLTQKFYAVNSFPQNSIRYLSAYYNSIIVSSWDGGIFIVNPYIRKIEKEPFVDFANKWIGNKRVKTAFLDKKNRLYVATYGSGLYIFKKESENHFLYENYKINKDKQEYLKSNIINKIFLTNEGVLWLCMDQPALGKLYYQENKIKYFNLLKSDKESELSEILTVAQSYNKNKLWVCINEKGICLFDTKNKSYENFTQNSGYRLKLQSNEVSKCYQDRSGNLWIVYRRIGLYVVPSRDALKLLDKNSGANVTPIDANLLLSTDTRFNSYITNFYEDSKNRIWVCLWGSMFLINLDNSFSSAHNSQDLLAGCKVDCIYTDSRDENLDFPIYPVFTMLETQNNTFWLGTQGVGIVELKETAKNQFKGKLLEINNELPQMNIKSLLKDHKNGIWIGTNSGLCYLKTGTKNLKIITKNDGLVSDEIVNIIEDSKNSIWISTNYGITKINPFDFSINNYLHKENEELNQYIINSATIDDNGQIWFSSSQALTTIDEDFSPDNFTDNKIYFADVKIDNITVSATDEISGTQIIKKNINECNEISVPYNHTLSLEFAILNYKSSGNILYKYRLNNENAWVVLGLNQRNINFSSMKPGKYVFEIMPTSSKAKENLKSLKINFLPPFWQSKPAYLVYFIILLSIFLTYRRLTIQRVLQKSVIEKERYERKKLEELDKMKSEFFSNISHEFRTPLSLIINPLEKLAKDGDISTKNKDRIGLILKSSNRLLKLTNELMDFSKIEKKLLIPEYQPIEIVLFVKEISQLFNNLADSMNIDFKFNCPFDQLEEILIDRGMIEKVIFNLLSNAFKYTPVNGVIMVNISKYHEAEIGFIKISVINTGEGITKENLIKIFDRFYQVNNVQNRNVEGTGIGLALVKNFVELHHGKVKVKSEPNIETCFDVLLPVKQMDYNISNESEVNTLKDINLSSEFRPNDNKPAFHYRLLLVEDEEDIRNYIVEELSADFKITTANDGETGIKLANEIIPDLVITDVMMPVISGIELCKTLKNQMSTSHIPIIILSAKTTINQQIEGLEMGADVYMIKPFNMAHLKTQILRLISFKENIYSRYLKETTLIPEGALVTKLDEEFMQKVIAFIEANLTDVGLSVEQLANCVLLSKVQTYRKVKAISGLSVVEFIRTIRLKKAAQMVLEKRLNFTEIAFETGFSSPSYFTRCFHDQFGKSPSEFASDYGEKRNN